MTAKLGRDQGFLGSFLAVYFVLLLLCFSASTIHGGFWLFISLTSITCCCIVFGWFLRYNFSYIRKYLKTIS